MKRFFKQKGSRFGNKKKSKNIRYYRRNNPFISDEIVRGYFGEIQFFLECINCGEKQILGFEFIREIIEVLYKAYAF